MSQREGANSRKMCGGPSRPSPHRDGEEPTRKGPAMAVSHLQCKECEERYPLDALYVCERCFGPLEVGYDHDDASATDIGELRRRIQGGPQNIWRYADFLPLAGGPPGPSGRLASRVGLPAGCTPLVRADRLAERLGLREVWVKNDAANPTHSFKDRVVSVAVDERPRARPADDRLRLHRQPRQLRRRPRGRAGDELLRVHPGRPRGAEGARHGHLRDQPGGRGGQLRRRQPPLHRAVRREATGRS